MNELELRQLSDEALNKALSALEPALKERDTQGGITERAGKAIAQAVPLRKELARRKELAQRDKLHADLQASNEKKADAQEKARRLQTIFKF
jgi:hypothetical protein